MTEKSLFRYGFLAVLALGLAIAFSWNALTVSAAAPIGLAATVATTSQLTIGPNQLYNATLGGYMGTTSASEKRLQCSARTISTTNSAIMMEFASSASTSLSGVVGNWQGASTTVSYDSGLVGCGYWSFFAYATTTITVTEAQ